MENDRLAERREQAERREYLIRALLTERGEAGGALPRDVREQKRLLRGLLNVRMPGDADPAFLRIQDAYLREDNAARGVVLPADVPDARPGIAVWKGDITRLAADAVVNAANSGLSGCYVPNHACIDNCIHTFAGIQLRLACDALMREQGHPEPPGQAKITRAYDLPAKYVIHTVGPIVVDEVTPRDRALLASCYRACFALAAARGLTSIAFCCISTGVFRFPRRLAAEIAVGTVRACLQEDQTVKKVIFNVFHDADEAIYRALLGAAPQTEACAGGT
jgi:O-acetyl-ADP-ribose deacetylase (regulator of RNase III)